MSAYVEMQLRGVRGVLDALVAIEHKLQRQISIKALRAGGQIIARNARQQAPRGQERRLSRAVIAGVSRKRSKDTAPVVLVRVRGGRGFAKEDPKNAYYAGWVEFGHRFVRRAAKGESFGFFRSGRARAGINIRRREATGTGTKRARARPFLAPAYKGTQGIVIDRITQTMRDEVAKLGKKT